MPKINPFKPGNPVSISMFVGRIKELKRLIQSLYQTKACNPINFLLSGERGIGKSSLLFYLTAVAKGIIPSDKDNFNFCVVEIDINESTTQLGLMKKIELGLDEELSKSEPGKKFLNDTWGFFKNMEFANFKLGDKKIDNEIILDKFARTLAKTVEKFTNDNESKNIFNSQYDGLLILIDEADNASNELELGEFLKILLERVQKQDCNNICIGLAGLPEISNILLKSHPSSLRSFPATNLGRLSDDEVKKVIKICLDEANEKNDEKTSIEDDAVRSLVIYSEGFPHFIQQFGYSAFERDLDNKISKNDVMISAFGEGGALEMIGNAYYRNDYYNSIRKASYRQVLRIMADNLDGWVKKDFIKKEFKGKQNTLDNAIRALRQKNIILSKEGVTGEYRLQHKGFALWIKFFTIEED